MKKTALTLIFLIQFAAFAAAFPSTVTDDDGTRYTIISRPARIVSTMPSNTEILFSLGLSREVVAVTDKCNYPPAALKKARIGSYPLNAEKVVSLNPDLVVMLKDAQKADVERFKELGLPVFVINPHNIADLIGSIARLGRATGKLKEADDLITRMKRKLNAVEKRNSGRTAPVVFVSLWPDSLITAGPGTFISDAVRLAGGRNLGDSARTPYPLLNPEELVGQDPDLIIIAGKSLDDIKRFRQNKRWSGIKAIRENRLLLIDSDLLTRPSPRIVDAVDLISTYMDGRIR